MDLVRLVDTPQTQAIQVIRVLAPNLARIRELTTSTSPANRCERERLADEVREALFHAIVYSLSPLVATIMALDAAAPYVVPTATITDYSRHLSLGDETAAAVAHGLAWRVSEWAQEGAYNQLPKHPPYSEPPQPGGSQWTQYVAPPTLAGATTTFDAHELLRSRRRARLQPRRLW